MFRKKNRERINEKKIDSEKFWSEATKHFFSIAKGEIFFEFAICFALIAFHFSLLRYLIVVVNGIVKVL
jgi:hypothetical protein